MSYRKVTATTTVALLVLAAAALFPLPLHVVSMFQIDPRDVQHVYTTTPGQLDQVFVAPGSVVKKGDKLAVLTNFEMEEKRHSLESEKLVQENEIRLYLSIKDPAQAQAAQVKRAGIQKQIDDYNERIRQLTLVAPCDGTVVASPRVEEPKLDVIVQQLHRWTGTPLDPKNHGAYLEERTHFLSIAPSSENDAVLYVDQGDRNDMFVGQEIELKFEHLADRTFEGKISRISDQSLAFAPTALSNKAGGELPTVTDDKGRERLTSSVYQATVTLAEEPNLIRPGMRGRARFAVDRRSAIEWLWRYIRRTFHFRL
jgi:putative peptide zinc metalloprotease protein